MSKNELRKFFLQKRKELSKERVDVDSRVISEIFLREFLPNNLEKVFAIYLSCNGEVSTTELIASFKQLGVKFAYPRIVAKDAPLEFVASQENQVFIANKFFPKVMEPATGLVVIPDMVIVPLVAFDAKLSRLGMGGGFFDRAISALKKVKPEILTIGLAYDSQSFEGSLPHDKTDQKLDSIITPAGAIFPESSIVLVHK